MAVVAALVVGYVMVPRPGGKSSNSFSRSLKALYDTDEFADVVTAARAQVGAGLRELASMIERPPRLARSRWRPRRSGQDSRREE